MIQDEPLKKSCSLFFPLFTLYRISFQILQKATTVELMPGSGVRIPLDVYTELEVSNNRGNNWEIAFRILLRAVFSRAELSGSSAKGSKSFFPALCKWPLPFTNDKVNFSTQRITYKM